MTKYIIPLIFTLVGFSSLAQETTTSKLSVQISNVQSIRINEQQQNVEISINTIEDFRNGKSSRNADHIEVMSNGKYEIRVVANGHLLKGDSRIDIDQIKLTPNFGTKGRSTNDINFFPIDLSLENSKIITSSKGDIIRSFNIEYHLKGNDQLLDSESGNYNTTVTYTIIAL